MFAYLLMLWRSLAVSVHQCLRDEQKSLNNLSILVIRISRGSSKALGVRLCVTVCHMPLGSMLLCVLSGCSLRANCSEFLGDSLLLLDLGLCAQ